MGSVLLLHDTLRYVGCREGFVALGSTRWLKWRDSKSILSDALAFPNHDDPLESTKSFCFEVPLTTHHEYTRPFQHLLMKPSLASSLMVGAALLAPITSAQQTAPEVVGTWTSKSRQVLTGPVCATSSQFSILHAVHRVNNVSRKWRLIRTFVRDFMTPSTTNSSNLHIPASHTLLPLMDFTKSPIIERSQIVRAYIYPRCGNPDLFLESFKPELPPGYNAVATWLLHEGCQWFSFTRTFLGGWSPIIVQPM